MSGPAVVAGDHRAVWGALDAEGAVVDVVRTVTDDGEESFRVTVLGIVYRLRQGWTTSKLPEDRYFRSKDAAVVALLTTPGLI